jgi:hypothetical protein
MSATLPFIVIPGRRVAASPESIWPHVLWRDGFRVRCLRPRPGMTNPFRADGVRARYRNSVERANPIHLSNSFTTNNLQAKHPRSRGVICPSFARSTALATMEGAGKAGCRPHPWLACEKARGRTTGTSRTSGLPCAMALRIIRALLGDRLDCPLRNASKRVLAQRQHRGARTTRLHRAHQDCSSARINRAATRYAHRVPHSTSVTTRTSLS